MKKIGLTLVLFLGISIASYACEAAFEGLKLEVQTFGKFETAKEVYEAYAAWVEVAC
tara:strand:- start:131 stop:301 length:171 start_codon:yes stop_codon:yes gene_type:complete